MKQALFWKPLKGGKVKCELCPRFCQVSKGKAGWCGVRQNQKGKLYSLVYGRACSISADPIEKKPLFHFAPGTKCLSIATVGCNLSCSHCQNWQVSHPPKGEVFGEELSPEDVVSRAKKEGLPGIAYTYTEPTVFFEYALDIMKLARKAGLYNIWVSNGYINPEPLKKAVRYLDAVNVDLKGDREFYKKVCAVPNNTPILEAMKLFKNSGVFLEVTNLMIPRYNDKKMQIRELVNWVKKELGIETPLHFSRFCPSYKMEEVLLTPVKTLDTAWKIAKNAGMKYVYIGNVPGHFKEDTYCPECKELVIKRTGYQIESVKGKCPTCGEKIPLAGQGWMK